MEENEKAKGSFWYKHTKDHAIKEWEKLERILLTVVSGTLAISITFLDIEAFPVPARDLVSLSWTTLFISLLALLSSYVFGELSCSLVLKELKSNLAREFTSEEVDRLDSKAYQSGIDWCNLIAIVSGVAGILYLALAGLTYVNTL